MPSFRAAIRHSALILASNGETSSFLSAAGARHIHLFAADSGVPPDFVMGEDHFSAANNEIVVHWSGRIEPRKGLPLALEAFAIACRNQALPLRLDVTGDGPSRADCEALARKLGVARQVRFLGKVPRAQVLEHLQRADAFLFTSLRDAVGSVCLESMAVGLPIILLDHQGVRHFVPPGAGWKVPPTTAPETVHGLAAAITSMARNREERVRRGNAAREFAQTQTWPNRVRLMESLYDQYRYRLPQST
jgi:glycosyltransferase involved in cell wall biosynthesis